VAAALKWTLAEMVAGIEPPNGRVARQLGIVQTDKTATPDLSLVGEKPSQLDRIEAALTQLSEEQEAFRMQTARTVAAVKRQVDAIRERQDPPRRQRQPSADGEPSRSDAPQSPR
jgi:sRNA-binding protein